MSKVFLDTNVLAYACDADQPEKRDQARALLNKIARESPPCVSTQVLQEFFVTVTRKMGVAPAQAKRIIHSLRHMETVLIDREDITRAIDCSMIWQISFWDALILTAARKPRCRIVYSEDLNNAQEYDTVRVVNPFR
ncbi:MAG: PIN domain-containing protein [Kiritimatiellae bacterium]|nr:PIN domain-containing protein [Kiritimatiellia bacterium]